MAGRIASKRERSLRNCKRSISSRVGKPPVSKAWEGERSREPKSSEGALESGLAGTRALPAEVCDIEACIFTLPCCEGCYSTGLAAVPASDSARAVMAGLAVGAPGAGL